MQGGRGRDGRYGGDYGSWISRVEAGGAFLGAGRHSGSGGLWGERGRMCESLVTCHFDGHGVEIR